MAKTLFILLLSLAGLAGCAELRQLQIQEKLPNIQPSIICPGSGADTWLGELNAIRGQSPEQQQQTLAGWEKSFQDKPDINNRMRLALLLATGVDSVRDVRRARRLLDGVDPLPEKSGDQEFIALMLQWLDDQSQSGRKLDILWKQVTEQNRRIEELEQQLQALTNIEQNIQSRDAPRAIEP